MGVDISSFNVETWKTFHKIANNEKMPCWRRYHHHSVKHLYLEVCVAVLLFHLGSTTGCIFDVIKCPWVICVPFGISVLLKKTIVICLTQYRTIKLLASTRCSIIVPFLPMHSSAAWRAILNYSSFITLIVVMKFSVQHLVTTGGRRHNKLLECCQDHNHNEYTSDW